MNNFFTTKTNGEATIFITVIKSLNYSLVCIFCLTVFWELVAGWMNLKAECCYHVCWCKVVSKQYFFDFSYVHSVWPGSIGIKLKIKYYISSEKIDLIWQEKLMKKSIWKSSYYAYKTIVYIFILSWNCSWFNSWKILKLFLVLFSSKLSFYEENRCKMLLIKLKWNAPKQANFVVWL